MEEISTNKKQVKVTEMPSNQEQEKVIKTLEEVIKFLKSTQIKNEDSFSSIKKPLDDLTSSLKYLPVETSFDILPTEIKTRILSYTCDNGAFVIASVCQDWKDILLKRLKGLGKINIGKHCSNVYKCEDSKCFMAEELMKASISLELDIPLSLCHPVTDVDSELIAKALTGVSDIIINEDCDCEKEGHDHATGNGQVMTPEQSKRAFEALGSKNKVMNSVELSNVNLNHLDQDSLVNFFLIKTKNLDLEGHTSISMIDFNVLITKLLEETSEVKLENLTLQIRNFEISDEMSLDFADALCKVEKTFLAIQLNTVVAKRLIENILTKDVKLKTLFVSFDWRTLIDPHELPNIVNKMENLVLKGEFTTEQIEVARTIPGLEVTWISLNHFGHNMFRIMKLCRGLL